MEEEIKRSEEIGGITGSNNKILIWVKDKPIIHQYILNDIYEKLSYANLVDLSSEKINKVDLVIISESARNIAVLTFNSGGNKSDRNSKSAKITEMPTIKQENSDRIVSNFLVFKLELFTELCINDNTLYLRYLRYITPTRNKPVKKLMLPKMYEQLYALSGSEVHTLDSHKLMGVSSFDVHPYGFFLAVSHSFNIKIYSLEHHSMTLLYNLSMHNIKKVLYSPNGAYIILFSPRRIKILDTFSF